MMGGRGGQAAATLERKKKGVTDSCKILSGHRERGKGDYQPVTVGKKKSARKGPSKVVQ